MIYNPFEEIISCGFFKNENEFKEEMPEFQGMFAIRTTDNYQISILILLQLINLRNLKNFIKM
jgi:hypothetical protein